MVSLWHSPFSEEPRLMAVANAASFYLSSSSSSSPSSSSSYFCTNFSSRVPSRFLFSCLNARVRTPTVRAVVTTTTAPTPAPEVSSSPIVLVDKADADKSNRLKTNYLEKVVPILKEEFGYKNIHQVPKIEKIVVNCGIGDAHQNSKGLEASMKDLSLITGQKPVKTTAKKSIASFKVREGTTVGIAVTLRRNVMYSFLDRLINLALPRTRDFQGLNPNSFDGHGNYSLGLPDKSVFPEMMFEAVGKSRGMDVCITTSANTDKEAQRLLALLGMPFKEGGQDPTVVVRKKKKKGQYLDSTKGKKA
ncbi:hypothetical protein HPP92_025313 [Vanilla planifolia]|uniref:Large ribosomal subunit protein uL5c n=1 Tax=Vanilla planifolia TaxID=51239 RepID=A0A835PIU4_VANPL|nr:hypothetical protein HPP92_025313 [Vanilla planifolia]